MIVTPGDSDCKFISFQSNKIKKSARKHLEQLEDFNGMRFIKDYEISLKRKVIEEGDELLQDALRKCKNIDLNKSDEELMAEIQSIKESMQSNLFVKGLLME